MPAPVYPPQAPGTSRITQSSLERYLRCGLLWKFSLESSQRFSTIALALGSAVHAAARVDNRAKLAGRPASVRELVENAIESYETETRDTEMPESPVEVLHAKDRVADAALHFARSVSPRYENVIECEEPIVARIGDIEIAGTPDAVTVDGIGDVKTGQPWTQNRVDFTRQLTTYGLLRRARTGVWPRRLWIDSLYERGGRWQSTRFYTVRQERHYAALLGIVQAAIDAQKKGIALPAPEGAWWCCCKWCQFWTQCPAVGN